MGLGMLVILCSIVVGFGTSFMLTKVTNEYIFGSMVPLSPLVPFLKPTGMLSALASSRCSWLSVVRAPMAPHDTRSAVYCGEIMSKNSVPAGRPGGAPAVCATARDQLATDTTKDQLATDSSCPATWAPGCIRLTSAVDLEQQLTSHAQAFVDLEGLIEVRVVDQPLPSDRGARLLEVDAHHDQQVLLPWLLRTVSVRGIWTPLTVSVHQHRLPSD